MSQIQAGRDGAGKGPPEQLGEGSDCKAGHRGVAHTLERRQRTVTALGGAGSWKTALGCLTGLQAGAAGAVAGGSGRRGLHPLPIPHSMCLRHQQGLETLAPLRLPGHSPMIISVRQEGTSEETRAACQH